MGVICLLLLCTAFDDEWDLEDDGSFKVKVVTNDPWGELIDVDIASLASDGFIIKVPDDHTLDAVYLDATEDITLLHGDKEITTGEIPVSIPNPEPGERIILNLAPGSPREGILFLLMPEGSENNPAFIPQMRIMACTGGTGTFTSDFTLLSLPEGDLRAIVSGSDDVIVHLTPEGANDALAAFDRDATTIPALMTITRASHDTFITELPCTICTLERCKEQCADCKLPCNEICYGRPITGCINSWRYTPEEEMCQDCILDTNEECVDCLAGICSKECFTPTTEELEVVLERRDCLGAASVSCPGCAGQAMVNATLAVTGDGTEQEMRFTVRNELASKLECDVTFNPPMVSHLNPKGFAECDTSTCTASSKYTASLMGIDGDLSFTYLFELSLAQEELPVVLPFSIKCTVPDTEKACMGAVMAALGCVKPPQYPPPPPHVQKEFEECNRRGKQLRDHCDHTLLTQELSFSLVVRPPAPKATPTPAPTLEPTPTPTPTPTAVATATVAPTLAPTQAPTAATTAVPTAAPTADAGTTVDRGDAEEALSKVERLMGRADAKKIDTAEIDALVAEARADMDDGAYADALRRLSTAEADLAEKLSEGDEVGSRNRMEMFMQFLEVAFGAAAFIIAIREARRREWVPGAGGTVYAGAAAQPQAGAYANYGSYYGTYAQYPGYGHK